MNRKVILSLAVLVCLNTPSSNTTQPPVEFQPASPLFTVPPLPRSSGRVAYKSRTDTATVQVTTIPNLGNLVGTNMVGKEDLNGNRVMRLTDAQTDPSRPNSHYVTANSGSADVSLFNKNSTLITITRAGNAFPFAFDPVTMQGLRLYASRFPNTRGLVLPSGTVHFSTVNPSLLFYGSGNGKPPQIFAVDFTDTATPPRPQLVFDFRKNLPGFGNITWYSDLTGSAGDAVFAIGYSNAGVSDTGHTVCVYAAGKGARVWDTQSGQVMGDWGLVGVMSNPVRFSIHNVRVSQNGQFVIVTPNKGVSLIWEIASLNAVPCAVNCAGHRVEGFAHWINAAPGNGNEDLHSYTDPTFEKQLVPKVPAGAHFESHQSWSNDDATDLQPVFNSTAAPLCATAWCNEIIGAATDGSGTVWRFGHTYNTGNCRIFHAKFGIGSVSQDGRFFAVTSDWQGQLGSTSGGRTCVVDKDCRSDVFIYELR